MLDCNMVKVIFCGYGEQRSIRIGTDVVFATIFMEESRGGVRWHDSTHKHSA